MPGPSFLAHEWRGASGNTIARLVRGGAFAETIGTTGITGSKNSNSTAIARSSGGTMVRYKGLLYAATYNGVSVLNPITGIWSTAHAFVEARFTGCPQEMLVIDTPTESYLVTAFQNNAAQRPFWVRFDGTTWVEVNATAGADIPASMRMIVFKGLIHAYLNGAGASLQTFNPTTLAFANLTMPAAAGNQGNGGLFVIDDRLFGITHRAFGGAFTGVYEFQGGAWIASPVAPPATTSNGGVSAAVVVDNEAFYFSGDSVADGLLCWKFSVLAPGGPLQFSAITAPVPPFLRAGTTVNFPTNFRCYSFADTNSTPGVVTHYLMFCPDGTVGAAYTLFRWIDESTEMATAASPQVNASSTPWRASQIFGGGEYLNGLGTTAAPLVTTSPRGNSIGNSGVKITYPAYGDFLRIPHGAITGAFVDGELATQAPSGATGIVFASSANETWLTDLNTGAWTDTEAFSTPSGSATQNAAAAGGAADKVVTARFYLGPGQTGLGAPVTGLCSMVPGSATGGGTVVVDGGGAGVDQVQGVVADGTEHSFEWDFLSDGVPEGLTANAQVFIERP